ncbi:MAG: 5'-methylthioadenosine/adenosylhomocysteine nucleosidase [Muribaculaceae bacterium]|nr:5'-methylthioadenosine/adenosylhomocysteine nucleosidase [Muribaculaceae bacterium]
MKIGILAAMDKELELLTELMENVTEEDYDGLHLYRGVIGPHDITAAKCGIGKVNSALNAFRMIRSEYLDLIINSGVAGGADTSMPIDSLLIADGVAYHDVWCGPGTVYGAADGMEQIFKPDDRLVVMAHELLGKKDRNVRFGLICSGDKFISSPTEIEEIKTHYPDALAVDMESASIAQVCRMNGVPFNIVRVVSDTPGSGENVQQYRNFWSEAPHKTFESLRTLIEHLD